MKELLILAGIGVAMYAYHQSQNPSLPKHVEHKAPTGTIIRPQHYFDKFRVNKNYYH